MRRLLTRAEAATLAGMLLAVFSLLLVWERIELRQVAPANALFANFKPAIHTGFHTGARNPILLGAFGSGALLLFSVTPHSRLPLLFAQGLCGLLVFVVALRWLSQANFAFLPGVVLGLLGGILLAFGAVDRLAGPPDISPPAPNNTKD